MGWTWSCFDTRSRKEFFSELMEPWVNEKSGAQTVCLKHIYRGAPWKGVLYTLWERRTPGEEKTVRYAVVYLIWRQTGGIDGPSWGYKDMDHSMCPYNYAFPLPWLEGLEDAGPYSRQWIAMVKEYWAARKEKRPSRISEISDEMDRSEGAGVS